MSFNPNNKDELARKRIDMLEERISRIYDLLRNIKTTDTRDTEVDNASVTIPGIDTSEFLLVDGSNAADFLDLSTATASTPAADVLRIMSIDEGGFETLHAVDENGDDIEVSRDVVHIVRNESGGTLTKGTAVTISGSTGVFPKVVKVDATDKSNDVDVLGLVKEDIASPGFGKVIELGDLEGVDTSSWTEGMVLFVDPTTPGGLTQTRPTGRNVVYPVAEVTKSNVSGILTVLISRGLNLDFRSIHYSTFLEKISLTVTSAGGVITASLDNAEGAGYLQAYFSNGRTEITSLPLTVDTNGTLTAGTDTAPQINYIYVLASAPSTLVASTSGWPAAEHIRVATLNLVSAATTATEGGARSNQNWNDEPSFEGSNPRGHLAHIGEHIRSRGANWESGVAGAGSTSGYITVTNPGGGDEVYFETGAGTIFQFHIQTWSVFDSATDTIYVKNDPDTAYNAINDLRAGITKDSGGTTIGNNKYFSIVFWGMVNDGGANNAVYANLPSSTYNSANAARADRDKVDDYSIPSQFKGVGFLICRITFQKTSTTWTVVSTDDLRGNRPSIAQGSFGAAQQTEFLDSNFRLQDNADPTKQVAFQASGITTATTRTITVPDRDLDLADPVFDSLSIENAGTGDNPVLSSNETTKDLNLAGRFNIVPENTVSSKMFALNDTTVRLTFKSSSSANGDYSIYVFDENTGSIADRLYLGGSDSISQGIIVDSSGNLQQQNDLRIDGNVGFYNTAAVAQGAAWTITNVTTDRSYDANSTTLAEIADALGTLVAELQGMGLLG